MPKVQAELHYDEIKGQDEVKGQAEGPLFRVFTHSGLLEKKDALVGVDVVCVCMCVRLCPLQTGELGKCECRYVTSALDAEYVYTQLYRQYTTSPHYLTKTPFLSSQIGSPQLRKVSVTVVMRGHRI